MSRVRACIRGARSTRLLMSLRQQLEVLVVYDDMAGGAGEAGLARALKRELRVLLMPPVRQIQQVVPNLAGDRPPTAVPVDVDDVDDIVGRLRVFPLEVAVQAARRRMQRPSRG